MSMEEAVDHHNEPLDGPEQKSLAEYDDDVPSISTSFGTVELEVELQPVSAKG